MAIGTPVSLGGAHSGSGASATHTLTCAAAVSVGETIVVFIASTTDNRVLNSVTDSAGNTYTIHQSNLGTGVNTYLATAVCTSALTTSSVITATWASSLTSTRQITACKVSGISPTPQDKSATSGSGTGWTGSSVANTTPDAIVLGYGRRGVNTNNTPAAGYTETLDVSGNTMTTTIMHKIVSAAGSNSPGGTWASNGAWNSISAVFVGADVTVNAAAAGVDAAAPAPAVATSIDIAAVPASVQAAAPAPGVASIGRPYRETILGTPDLAAYFPLDAPATIQRKDFTFASGVEGFAAYVGAQGTGLTASESTDTPSGSGKSRQVDVTMLNSTSNVSWYGNDPSTEIPISSGQVVKVGAWFKALSTLSGFAQVRVVVRCMSAARTYLGAIPARDIGAAVTGGWQYLEGDVLYASLPAGTAYVTVETWVRASAASTFVSWLTDEMFVETLNSIGFTDAVGGNPLWRISTAPGVSRAKGAIGASSPNHGVEATHAGVSIGLPNADHASYPQFSSEFWLYVPDGSAPMPTNTLVIGNFYEPTAPAAYEGWRFVMFNGTAISFVIGTAERTYSGAVSSSTPFSPGWNHIVGTYDGTIARLYINGTQRGTRNPAQPYVPRTSVPASAAPRISLNAYWDGRRVDDWSIYSRALSAAEVAAHYDAGVNAIIEPPAAAVTAAAPAPAFSSDLAVAAAPAAVAAAAPAPGVLLVPDVNVPAAPAGVEASAPAPAVLAAPADPVPAGQVASTSTNSATATVTLTQDFAVGDVVLVACGRSGNNQTLASVTDSKGNTYRVVEEANTAAINCNAHLAAAVVTTPLVAGDTIFVTWSSTFTSTRRVIALKATGLSTVDPIAPTAESSGTGTAWSGGSVASNRASGVILGVADVASAATNTPPAGWGDQEVAASSRTLVVTWRTVDALGTYDANGTLSSSSTWQALTAMLRATGGDQAISMVPAGVEVAAPAGLPSTYVPGADVTIAAAPASVDAAVLAPTLSDFPIAAEYENGDPAENPLSRSGAWISTPLGLTRTLQATSSRITRQSGTLGQGVFAGRALPVGASIVDLHGTVSVKPGAAGGYLEHGVILAADQASAAWDGYVIGLSQSSGIYLSRVVDGVATQVIAPFLPGGADLAAGDGFGMRLRPVEGGVMQIEMYVRRGAGRWDMVETYGDPSPIVGQASTVVRVNGNNSGGTVTAAIDALSSGASVNALMPAVRVDAAGPAPRVTFPGVPVTINAAPAAIAVAGVPVRESGAVTTVRMPPADVEVSLGDRDPRDVTVEVGIPAPSVVIVESFIRPGGIDLTLDVGAATITPGTVTVRPGGIDLALGIGGARILPGPITVRPGGIDLTLGVGAALMRPGAITLRPGGIDLALDVGGALLLPGPVKLVPGGIELSLGIGAPVFLPGPVKMTPGGVELTLDIGSADLIRLADATLTPGGIELALSIGGPERLRRRARKPGHLTRGESPGHVDRSESPGRIVILP